jgi:hypothetical protein
MTIGALNILSHTSGGPHIMGWQGRDGRRYFYLARRRNGRQENVYFGKGPVAELAAAKVEERKSQRDEARKELRTIQDDLRTLDSLIATVDRGVARLLEATLLGQGYYRDDRRWRGARRVRALAANR